MHQSRFLPLLFLALAACSKGSSGGGSTTTIAGSGPEIAAVFPPPGSAGIPVSTTVEVNFSTPVDPKSVGPATLLLFRGSNQVAGTVSLEGQTATFQPAAPLAHGSPYTAMLSQGVADAQGVPLPGEFQWIFSTEVFVPPLALVATFPADGAIEVAPTTTVSATFSEAIDSASVGPASFQLLDASGVPVPASYQVVGETITLDPDSLLDGLASYEATLGTEIRALSGTKLASPISWSFMTREQVPCDFVVGPVGDCDGNGIDDSIDILNGSLADCNGNCVPDPCEGEFLFHFGTFSPVDVSSPKALLLPSSPPPAAGDVVLTIGASANLAGASEKIDVNLNGVPVGAAFENFMKFDCPASPAADRVVIPAATFNAAQEAGGVVFDLKPSAEVDAASCPTSFLVAYIQYLPEGHSGDCDRNGVPDACETDCNGNGIKDSCEMAPTFHSPEFSPIGGGLPEFFFLVNPPNPGLSTVNVTATASADLNLSNENIELSMGITALTPWNNFFQFGGIDCASPPQSELAQIPGFLWSFFNQNFPAFTLRFTPTLDVDPSQCNPPSFLSVQVVFPPQNDCNGNGTLDACDIASGLSQDANGNGIPDECQ